jgi:tetratricopeptide (TPR) repeat protein
MAFDKIKAMRNAEKFLAQGKIKAAIGEYKQVVDNDPKDFGTMNLLGDLYSKAEDTNSALRYYDIVAEHYSKQGFNQKAIAVYNKISRLQPNSPRVSEKLAELYKGKGSVTEAKSHYVILAENYQAKGRMVEALAMWKQIAILDPANTEVYPNVAASYLKEGQIEEAVDAFADAGDRFISRGFITDSENAYLTGLEHIPSHGRCLSGYVNLQIGQGRPHAAVEKLESLVEEDKSNREALNLLADCYLEAGDKEKAEKTVIKLVEHEPASYPKFLDVAKRFIADSEFDGACRMLTMASEHMIAGGQAEELAAAVRTILDNQPGNLDATRLLVRFCTWQKDEEALKDSLRGLAELANGQGSVDDERFSLSQLVMLVPQEARYAERLREINAELGYDDDTPVTHSMFGGQFFASNGNGTDVPAGADFAIVGAVIESSNGQEIAVEVDPSAIETLDEEPAASVIEAGPIDDSPEARRRREAESIRFYIDNGYTELAEKAIEEFRTEYPNAPETADLIAYLSGSSELVAALPEEPEPAADEPAPESNGSNKLFDLGELRNELGLEEPEAADDSDFETKYNTAIAYKEMGLLEQAIAEFQDAAALVGPNDGTRRFFNCANLLGHSFMENGMPKLAEKWYKRALEINNLNTDEKQALWYELGVISEVEGDFGEAGRYFELVYAENVDFRDVRDRLKNMAVAV